MFLTAASISTLMNWFNHEASDVSFMCIILAGSIRDKSLFSNILENKNAIDVILGRELAFFLFINQREHTISVQTKPDTAAILPGQLIHSSRIHLPKIWVGEVTDISESSLKTDIINASQSIAHQIVNYFGIDVADIPAVLLICKDDSEPWIIHTRGEINVEDLYGFFKELREIAERIPSNYSLSMPYSDNKSLLSYERYKQYKTKIITGNEKICELIQTFCERLYKYGMRKNELDSCINSDLLFKTKHFLAIYDNVSSAIGKKGKSLSIEDQSYLQDKLWRLRKAVRDVKKKTKQVEVYECVTEELRRVYRNSKKELDTVESVIQKLCDKWERRFTRRARAKPLMTFIRKFLGLAGYSNKLLDLQKKLSDLQ